MWPNMIVYAVILMSEQSKCFPNHQLGIVETDFSCHSNRILLDSTETYARDELDSLANACGSILSRNVLRFILKAYWYAFFAQWISTA